MLCSFLGNTYRVAGEDCLTTQLEAPNIQGIVQHALTNVVACLQDDGNVVRPGYTAEVRHSHGNAINETVSASGSVAWAGSCHESRFARSKFGARVIEQV